MKIEITDHRKIYEIQKEFSALFPFLKLDFFSKPHTSGGASPKDLMVNSNKSIGECRTIHTKGTLTITPHMTVNDLQNEFADTFGVTVRVFRKVGTDWLETSADMSSLEKQNAIASEPKLTDTSAVL